MILLASSYEEMLDSWRRSLSDVSAILCINDLELLSHEFARRKPSILFVDHDFLGNDSSKKVESLLALSPKTQIIISSPGISDEMEWKLFKSGIRGCCRDLIDAEEIRRVVKAVWQGNKQIARRLDITERTVKAHLTEIFRKLAITDRIKLALLVKDTAVTSNQSTSPNSNNFPIVSA